MFENAGVSDRSGPGRVQYAAAGGAIGTALLRSTKHESTGVFVFEERADWFSLRILMLLFVMTFIAVLAAIAFGFLSFQTTSERITVSIEIGKFRPIFAWLKEAASRLREKGHEYREHSRES
jgi:hypothetical protein